MNQKAESSTIQRNTYREWIEKKKILSHMRTQFEKKSESTLTLLKELQKGEWSLDEINDSGILGSVRRMIEFNPESEIGVLCTHITKKFRAQKLREENPEKSKKRGFQFETAGSLRQGADFDGPELICILIEGMTKDGQIFSIPLRSEATVMSVFRKLNDTVGLPRKYLKLEVDGFEIKPGKKLKEFGFKAGQEYRLFRND